MDVWMGLIFPSAISFAPYGSVYCQGQTMAISQNTALFSLLGTTFGGDGSQTFGIPDLRGRVAVGIGAGPGLAPVVLGQKFGTSSVTLVANNLPAHNHPASFAPTIGTAPISITVGSGGTGLNASVGALTVNGTLAISTATAGANSPTSANRLASSATTSGGEAANIYGSPEGTNTWPVGGSTAPAQAPVNGTISGNANMVNGGNVSVGNNVTANTPVAITPPSLGLAYIIMTTGIYPPRP